MVLRLKTRESRSLPGLLKAMLSAFVKANTSGFASQIHQSSQHKIGPSRKHRAAASGPFCLLKSLKRNNNSCALGAGWSSPVARQAHNLKAAGSNPAPATKISKKNAIYCKAPRKTRGALAFDREDIEQVTCDLRSNFPPVSGESWAYNLASCGVVFHSHFYCEFAGGDIAERRVRSVSVVILLPCGKVGAGLSKRREQGLVEALVAETSVEASTKLSASAWYRYTCRLPEGPVLLIS